MAKELTMLTGFNIANVEGVMIVTREEEPRTLMWKTLTDFEAESNIEEGQEVTQKVKGTIMGLLKEEDVIKGYDLTAEDERLIPEILALVDGGTWDESEKEYSAPAQGSTVERTAFDTYLYTSDRGTGGEIKNYLRWLFPNCKGSPVKLGAKDNEFHKQEYNIKSRPADGESAFKVKAVDEMFGEAPEAAKLSNAAGRQTAVAPAPKEGN